MFSSARCHRRTGVPLRWNELGGGAGTAASWALPCVAGVHGMGETMTAQCVARGRLIRRLLGIERVRAAGMEVAETSS